VHDIRCDFRHPVTHEGKAIAYFTGSCGFYLKLRLWFRGRSLKNKKTLFHVLVEIKISVYSNSILSCFMAFAQSKFDYIRLGINV
jgi:hypothetical protein